VVMVGCVLDVLLISILPFGFKICMPRLNINVDNSSYIIPVHCNLSKLPPSPPFCAIGIEKRRDSL
jgi:hypothetical protein